MRHGRSIGLSCLFAFLFATMLAMPGCDSGTPASGTGPMLKNAPPPPAGAPTSADFNKKK